MSRTSATSSVRGRPSGQGPGSRRGAHRQPHSLPPGSTVLRDRRSGRHVRWPDITPGNDCPKRPPIAAAERRLWGVRCTQRRASAVRTPPGRRYSTSRMLHSVSAAQDRLHLDTRPRRGGAHRPKRCRRYSSCRGCRGAGKVAHPASTDLARSDSAVWVVQSTGGSTALLFLRLASGGSIAGAAPPIARWGVGGVPGHGLIGTARGLAGAGPGLTEGAATGTDVLGVGVAKDSEPWGPEARRVVQGGSGQDVGRGVADDEPGTGTSIRCATCCIWRRGVHLVEDVGGATTPTVFEVDADRSAQGGELVDRRPCHRKRWEERLIRADGHSLHLPGSTDTATVIADSAQC